MFKAIDLYDTGMSEFVDFLHEVFASFGSVTTRKMFGGHGIYHQQTMFGLVADDVLYLKADEQSESQFRDLDLAPFEYLKNGKPMKMSYFAAPEEIYDDPDLAAQWVALAYDAAIRAKR